MRRRRSLLVLGSAAAAVATLTTVAGTQPAKSPVKVALVAAMSGGSALSGEAIKRGLTVAIDEINARAASWAAAESSSSSATRKATRPRGSPPPAT